MTTTTAKTLAIVDDDPNTLRMLGRYFEHYGFRVVTARDGVEALEVIGATSPDLVILDVMMPKLDGYEVAQQLRDSRPTLPIIMFTARVDMQDKLRGLMTGAHRYLTKPCSPVKVMDEVVKLLGLGQKPDPPAGTGDLNDLGGSDDDYTSDAATKAD